MNKLPSPKRAMILGLLLEGASMQSIVRLTGVAFNSIAKLLMDAGAAAADYHDSYIRDIKGKRFIECDEIWSFLYAKKKNVMTAVAAPKEAGDTWTWIALDADSKLLVSYLVSTSRGFDDGYAFIRDLESRLNDCPQLSTDGLGTYREVIDALFGREVDYTMIGKDYNAASKPNTVPAEAICSRTVITGTPDLERASTSYVERHNLTMRMGMRRFARRTNGFSKRFEKHAAMTALYVLHYNFCRIHSSHRVTPAMEIGLDDTLRDLEWIVGLIDARAPRPNRPKTYRKRMK